MALNADTLTQLILTNLSSIEFVLKDINGDVIKTVKISLDQKVTVDNKSGMEAIVGAIAKGVIDHFKAAAVVSSSVSVVSVSGVTTGTGVSGTGAGSATGTIS